MTSLFILYQMGNSEEWTWFSPVGVFLSEKALREHGERLGVDPGLELLVPSAENEVHLKVPQEYVFVQAPEGAVPDVELELEDDGPAGGIA